VALATEELKVAFLDYWWKVTRKTKPAAPQVSSHYASALDNYRGFDDDKFRASLRAFFKELL
jgi:hypothetical protein